MFRDHEVAQGIHHIQDALGVCFTLIDGGDSALLVDTGYGLENVKAYVDTLTEAPVCVLLTHGHHDHVLGSRWFDTVRMRTEDLEEFRLRTGRSQRSRILEQARGKGIVPPERYTEWDIRDPLPFEMPEKAGGFQCRTVQLGKLNAQVIHVPGHTPGSLMVYLPEEKLLLTGDNWNPCTWLWFPSSVGIAEWRRNLHAVLDLLPFQMVLCSHRQGLYMRKELEEYLADVTDDAIRRAPEVDMGSPVRTCRLAWPDGEREIIFDREKAFRDTEPSAAG